MAIKIPSKNIYEIHKNDKELTDFINKKRVVVYIPIWNFISKVNV